MLTKKEIEGYLHRIGIPEIQPPTKSYLFELHKAHVKHIPWQTLDIFAGKPVPIDIEQSVRLMLAGRSGYCFHLNGAFSELLRSLGYRVSWHRAGVQPPGEEPRINSFHLGLTVDLPSTQGGSEQWIVEVGLGDMPFEPVPLQMGVYAQGPYTYTLTRSGVAKNGWRLEQDPLTSLTGVDYDPHVVRDLEQFKPKHEHYSRSPDSPWMKLFILRHRHENGGNELRGCVWSRREGQHIVKTEIETKSRWFEVMGDIFGEHLVAYDSLERDELWNKARTLHEEWKKSRRDE